MIERITVPGLRPPSGPFCHVTKAGPNVWASGVVGMRKDGSVPESTVEQFDVAMETLAACLAAAGAGPEHVVKIQVFMTDASERGQLNARRIAYFGDHLPASTLVEVKGLVDPRLKVEIEAQAWLG